MNSRGFIWIETLISLHVVLLITMIIIPIYTTIKKEKQVFDERSVISMELFNEFQQTLNPNAVNDTIGYTKDIKNRKVRFDFRYEGKYLKGCAKWINIKKNEEKRCLYRFNEK